MGGGVLGFYVAGWGQVRRGMARRHEDWTRHHDLGQQRQVSAAWVAWQGRCSSRPRQSARRRAGEAGAAGEGGVRACERAQRGGACVMEGRDSRACATEERGQLVLARGGVCVRACQCVEAGRRLTGVCGWLGWGVLGFYVAGWGQVRRRMGRQQVDRARHHDLGQQRQVSAVLVSWQGRGSSRPRQSARRRASEADAAGGGGVRACERAQRGGACVMAGRGCAPAEPRREGSWCWRVAGVV